MDQQKKETKIDFGIKLVFEDKKGKNINGYKIKIESVPPVLFFTVSSLFDEFIGKKIASIFSNDDNTDTTFIQRTDGLQIKTSFSVKDENMQVESDIVFPDRISYDINKEVEALKSIIEDKFSDPNYDYSEDEKGEILVKN